MSSQIHGVCVAPNPSDEPANVGGNLPVGSMIAFAGPSTATPDTWLYCDGANVSRQVYANLFSVIGTGFGAGDGTPYAFVQTYLSGSSSILYIQSSTTLPTWVQTNAVFTMTGGRSGYSTYIWTVIGVTAFGTFQASATSGGAQVIFPSGIDTTAGTIIWSSPTTFNIPNTTGRLLRGVGTQGTAIVTLGGAAGSDTTTISADNLPQHRHGINDGLGYSATGLGNGEFSNFIRTGSVIQATTANQTYTNAATPTSVTNSAITQTNPYLGVGYIIKY